MRTHVVHTDGYCLTVRGRTRRTTALESEYLVSLKQAHPDMRDAQAGSTDAEALVQRNPRAWSLLGTASSFRYLVARLSEAETPTGDLFKEPFKPDLLVELFDHFLDAEQLPDKSDLWSQVEATIESMDKPEVPTTPLGESNS